MNRSLFQFLTVAGLAVNVSNVASAQCRTCAPPVVPVVPMAAPVNCTISQTRPVVTTQLRAQQVTTFRDVTETQVQRQQVVQNVPVTTAKNVTVDEGGYQMVWVARPVTKQVVQTTIQQQVKTVDVPVQVTRRVPQTMTQMVPVQSVQYVTQQVPVQTVAVAQPYCDMCGNGVAYGVPMMAPQVSYVAPIYQTVPVTTAFIPTTVTTLPQTAAVPAPYYQPNVATAPPTAAPASASSAAGAYETVPAREVPVPKDEAATPPRKTSMSGKTPTAASVWQSRANVIR